jgi:hypothetical protein
LSGAGSAAEIRRFNMTHAVIHFSTPENSTTLTKADYEELYTCVRDAMLNVKGGIAIELKHNGRRGTIAVLEAEYDRLARLAERTYRLSGGLGDHL